MNLFTALFDVRFERLISRRLLGVVYAIALGLHLLAGIVMTIVFLVGGDLLLPLALVAVVVTVLGALFLRMLFEAAAAFFRATEDLRAIRAGAPS